MIIFSVGKGLRIWVNIGRSVIILTFYRVIWLYMLKVFEIVFIVI